MPRIFRVTLPVADLPKAQRFYSALLGDDGEAAAQGWHTFSFGGAMLALHDAAGEGRRAAPHQDPVWISVEESLTQVHYRAQSLGAQHVDDEPGTLPTGESGFVVVDPWGNALCLVDERSVAWQLQRPLQTAQPAPRTAAEIEAGQMGLERDFINAVKGGDLETVQSLLSIDPDLVEATDSLGVSAMLHAAYKGHATVAEFLLQRNPDLTLWEAAAFGQQDRLRHLLERGFKVNVYSADGFTPLGLACFFGHPACVKLLLERGADPNAAARNDMQVRPLHSAVARAPEDAVVVNLRGLIAKGADINATQQGGYTALHQAADRGHEAVVKLLLSAGARKDPKSAAGRTPADHARAKGHARVVALLS
jgi:uncharacterized protein